MPAIRNERSSPSSRAQSYSSRPPAQSLTPPGRCPCRTLHVKDATEKREVRVCLRVGWQQVPGGLAGEADPRNLITADLHTGKGHETLNLHRKRSLRRAFLLCSVVKGLGVRSVDIASVEDEHGRPVDRNTPLPAALGERLDTATFFVTFRCVRGWIELTRAERPPTYARSTCARGS